MFLPENIDLGRPEKYTLSIRIKPDGFAFFIYEIENHDRFCFQQAVFSSETTLSANIRRIIFDYSFLTENFRQVNVVFVTRDYELFPAAFYDRKIAEKFYAFTHTKDVSCVLTDGHENEDYSLLFDVDEELYLFLKRSLFNPRFYHYSGVLMGYSADKVKQLQGNKMLVYFQDDFVNIACYGVDNRVLSAHTYYKECFQDIIYYMLSIWEKSGFDQLSDHLVLTGNAFDERIGETLKDYVKNICRQELSALVDDLNGKWQEVPLDLLVLTK